MPFGLPWWSLALLPLLAPLLLLLRDALAFAKERCCGD